MNARSKLPDSGLGKLFPMERHQASHRHGRCQTGRREVQDRPPHAQKAEEGTEDGRGHSEALSEESSPAKTGQCFEKKSRLPLGWNVGVHSPPYGKIIP